MKLVNYILLLGAPQHGAVKPTQGFMVLQMLIIFSTFALIAFMIVFSIISKKRSSTHENISRINGDPNITIENGEKVFFQRDEIKITDSRLIFGNKIIPVNSLNSVKLKESKSIVFGIVSIISGLFVILQSLTASNPAGFPFALLLIAGGIVFIVLRIKHPLWFLIVNYTKGRSKLLKTYNKARAFRIANAINAAMLDGKHQDSLPRPQELQTEVSLKNCPACGISYDETKAGNYCSNCGKALRSPSV